MLHWITICHIVLVLHRIWQDIASTYTKKLINLWESYNFVYIFSSQEVMAFCCLSTEWYQLVNVLAPDSYSINWNLRISFFHMIFWLLKIQNVASFNAMYENTARKIH